MYKFVGRYDGVDKSSSKRIIIATPIMIICFAIFFGGNFYLFKNIIPKDFFLYDILHISFYVLGFIASLIITYDLLQKLTGNDSRPPELAFMPDGNIKYRKFHKNKEDFDQYQFMNMNLKVIENENKTIMVTTEDGEQYVLFKQYQAMPRTLKDLKSHYPNQHYNTLLKWFEVVYDKREEKLTLELSFCTDMDKRGVFDMNSVRIF